MILKYQQISCLNKFLYYILLTLLYEMVEWEKEKLKGWWRDRSKWKSGFGSKEIKEVDKRHQKEY